MAGNQDLLAKVKRKGAMHIIYITGSHGSVRFKDLESHIPLSNPTISTRLDELEAARLLERTFFDEMPPRVEYALTEKAEELYDHLTGLFEWAAERERLIKPTTGAGQPRQTQSRTCVCCETANQSSTDAGSGVPWYRIVDGLIDLMKKTFAMQTIVYVGAEEPIRCNALKELLGATGDTAVTARLDEFQESDLVERRAYDEVPPRVEYSLTDAGHELREYLQPLHEWGNRGNS